MAQRCRGKLPCSGVFTLICSGEGSCRMSGTFTAMGKGCQ